MDGTRGDVCGSEAKRYIDVIEWVTMGWGLFIDTYIPDLTYLTLHVVDLSISLLPLSLSLSLPSSQLHISISVSRLVLSQCLTT